METTFLVRHPQTHHMNDGLINKWLNLLSGERIEKAADENEMWKILKRNKQKPPKMT